MGTLAHPTGDATIHGGAASTADGVDHRCAHRSGIDGTAKGGDLGFRCCKGPPNAAAIPPPKTGDVQFTRTPMDIGKVRKMCAAIPQLAPYAKDLTFFSEDDAIKAVLGRGDGGVKPGPVLTTSPVSWTPVPTEEVIVMALRAKSASLIVAFYRLGEERFRLASSLVLKDEQGDVTVDVETTATWLGGASAPKPKPELFTFRDSFFRYASAHDIFRLLEQRFPDGRWSEIKSCNELGERNRALAGDYTAATGERVYRAPSSVFVRWYLDCLRQGILRALEKAAPLRLFGPAVMQTAVGKPLEPLLNDLDKTRWEDLPDEVRQEIAGHWARFLFGARAGDQGKELIPRAGGSLREVVTKIAIFGALDDRFLIY